MLWNNASCEGVKPYRGLSRKDSIMTTFKSNQLVRNSSGHHALGWTLSVLYHLIGFSGVLFCMSEINKSIHLDTFQWQVSVIEAPREAERMSTPVSFPATPMPPQPYQAERVVDSQSPNETVQTVQYADRERVTTQMQSSNSAVPSRETPQLVARADHANPATIMARAKSVAEQYVVVKPDKPIIQYRTVLHRQVQYLKTQADYGWLRDMLRNRLEELKHYPALAKANHWEGNVIVQAIIKADGTVGDVRVAESSGNTLLDEEALTVMRKVSPLRLKYQLEGSQMTILVPISYRLEG